MSRWGIFYVSSTLAYDDGKLIGKATKNKRTDTPELAAAGENMKAA